MGLDMNKSSFFVLSCFTLPHWRGVTCPFDSSPLFLFLVFLGILCELVDWFGSLFFSNVCFCEFFQGFRSFVNCRVLPTLEMPVFGVFSGACYRLSL